MGWLHTADLQMCGSVCIDPSFCAPGALQFGVWYLKSADDEAQYFVAVLFYASMCGLYVLDKIISMRVLCFELMILTRRQAKKRWWFTFNLPLFYFLSFDASVQVQSRRWSEKTDGSSEPISCRAVP